MPAPPAPTRIVVPAPSRPVPWPGRLWRLLRRYGWRTYAIPLLVAATVFAVIDLLQPGRSEAPAGTATTATDPGTSSSTGLPGPLDAAADGESAPTGVPTATGPEGADYVEQGLGTETVVPGSSAVLGTGPLHRFAVEVEDGIDVDGAAFAAAVEATLADPRGWGSGGRMSFQRVGVEQAAAGEYEFRVILASPGSMETYCPGAGTGGYTSCRYGDRAVINLARWQTAVPDYEGDVATYRLYVVNHEVGHALGNGHQTCPGPGELAPVMQQQTLGLDGCTKNPWPYP